MGRFRGKEIGTEVELTMSMIYGVYPEEYRIEITDDRSRSVIAEIKMPAAMLANLVSSRPVKAKAKVYRSLTFGRYVEMRTISVPLDIDDAGDVAMQKVRQFLRENWPGWEMLSEYDSYTYRNRTVISEKQFYEVKISKFNVEKPKEGKVHDSER